MRGRCGQRRGEQPAPGRGGASHRSGGSAGQRLGGPWQPAQRRSSAGGVAPAASTSGLAAKGVWARGPTSSAPWGSGRSAQESSAQGVGVRAQRSRAVAELQTAFFPQIFTSSPSHALNLLMSLELLRLVCYHEFEVDMAFFQLQNKLEYIT